ncbi:TonB family protein [Hymenobacter sp. BT188]|uniref:TonB family protein n=1 Tax=Hymenobacter sp. BT188 TaxID=2763504 RepID=UPI001650F9B3|nr:M56 family metallopeptidase [Hymenobacter sp. BT188]MBC6608464.1 TonB family protein [Hymenobacter sp. BT188]
MNPISLLKWMMLSTVLLSVWWLCYHLALRRERSFGYNRTFLVLGPLLAASLPLLPLGWPSSWAAGPTVLVPGIATVLLPTAQVGASSSQVGLHWSQWVMVGYIIGVLATLARLCFGLARLWLTTRHRPCEKQAGYTLVRTGGQLPSSSFGRVVFWDESLPLSDAEAHQVLQHELAHVQQGHTYDRLLLEVLSAVLWFNPFVHLCARALTLTHEYLADAAALSADTTITSPSHSYTHLLARQVATRLGFSLPLAHSFSHSQTLRRIAMIHQTSPIRRWKQWLALPLVALLAFTVACERHTEPVAPSKRASSQNAEMSPPPPPPPPAPDAEPAPPPPPPPTANSVYNSVEEMPLFRTGNNNDIVAFIQSKLKYPAEAVRSKVKGRVIIAFIVDKEGNVTDASVEKGIGSGCDEAALNAVRQLPRFTPGKQNGEPVAVRFVVPIQFAPYSVPISNLFGGLVSLPKC